MNYIELLKENDGFEYWQGASDFEISNAEKELGISFTPQYKEFLSQCGMCNFSDLNILGIAKDEDKTSYPVVEVTKEMRDELNIANEVIILSYEVGEYLTLYEKDNKSYSVFGASIKYEENEKMKLGKKEKLFDSFEEYFNDFIKLGE